MKARIKKTGEIVNLAEYAKITLDQWFTQTLNAVKLKIKENNYGL